MLSFWQQNFQAAHEKIKPIITPLAPSDIQNNWVKEVSAIIATHAIVSIPQLILYLSFPLVNYTILCQRMFH